MAQTAGGTGGENLLSSWNRETSDAPWNRTVSQRGGQEWDRDALTEYLKKEITKNKELFSKPLDPSTEIKINPLAGEGCSLTFKDVGFSLTLPDGTPKTILEPVSGHFEPGNLVAIMGPSGCGKSTLLDMLANKKTAHYIGQILVNGHKRDHLFQRLAAYVGQEDVMPQFWMVKEAIAFNAALKTNPPKDAPREVLEGRLEAILSAFGLESVAETFLGGPKVRGCSGGQRRRVTLARGVVQGAKILFLDEPTSGLSATDAQLCVKSMRIIAQRFNILIMVVIHQPRVEVANLFDKLILLTSNPGRMIYNGAMKDAMGYWQSRGHTVPSYANPTDFYLDLVTPGSPTDHTDEFVEYYKVHQKPGVEQLVDAKVQVQGFSSTQVLEETSQRLAQAGADAGRMRLTTYASPLCTQFFLLLRRKIALTKRNKAAIIFPVMVPCFQGLLMGVMFQGIGDQPLQFQISFFFLLLTMLCMKGMQNLPTLIDERTIMKYETSETLYSEVAFILVTFAVDIPLNLLGSVFQVLIMYTFSGLNWKYFSPVFAWAVYVFFVFDSMFAAIGAFAPDSQTAQVCAIPFNSIFMMFSGFMVTKSSAPSYLVWIFTISPMAYAIQSIVCMLAEDSDKPQDKALPDFYGFEDDQTTQGIIILACMILFFRVLQIVALKTRNNIQK